jgi:hypothetical protein
VWQGRDQINELIIDTGCVNERLPHSIDAIFYPSACGPGSSCRREAEEAHSGFLTTYGLTADESPLVRVDVHDWDTPFSRG